MKRYLLSAILAFSSSLYAFTPNASTRVWVCVGGSAYAYHSTETCSGFQHCKHTMKTTTLDSAVKVYKRRPCKECYH